MKIWLDDIRKPPDDTWVCAFNYQQFEDLLKANADGPAIEVISFDHDLGLGPEGRCFTGYDCIKLLGSNYPMIYPEKVLVHSANPIGADSIINFDAFFRGHRQKFLDALDYFDTMEDDRVKRSDLYGETDR